MAKNSEGKKSKKTIDMPVVGIIDNIVLSKKSAWAYFVLADQPYDFLDHSSKFRIANETQNALASLATSSNKQVDCHLLISNTVFSVNQWENQYRHGYEQWDGRHSVPFEKFIEAQKEQLLNKEYKKRITFLGIKLYNRGSLDFNNTNILEFGPKQAWETFKKNFVKVFKMNAEEITADEEQRARSAEADIFRILSEGSLGARRPSGEEVLLTIKRRFYPAMPTPYLETNHEERIGMSDIVMESGGIINVGPRWLKFNNIVDGEEMEGYRATLSFSKFPKSMYQPGPLPPFFYRREILPFTCNARFTLIPVQEMKDRLHKKKLDQDDEIKNFEESGQRPTQGIINSIRETAEIESNLEEARFPWVAGSYRITVEAPTPEALQNIISKIKQEYANHDIMLSWTSGDQLQLFREELFGNELEIGSFVHTTNMAMLSAAGLNFGGTVGDPIGGF